MILTGLRTILELLKHLNEEWTEELQAGATSYEPIVKEIKKEFAVLEKTIKEVM